MLRPQDRLLDLFLTPESFDDMADSLGLTPEELEDKIDGKEDFLSSEIRAIAQNFQLSGKDILEMFFPQPLQKTVSDNVKQLNGEELYEIDYLAHLTRMDSKDLLYKINGERELTISDLEKIAQALDKPAEYFLERHF